MRLNERGSNLASFAATLPWLLVLVFGIFFTGALVHGKIALTGATREANRHFAVNQNEAEACRIAEEYIENTKMTGEFKGCEIFISDDGLRAIVEVNFKHDLPFWNLFGIFGGGNAGTGTLSPGSDFLIETPVRDPSKLPPAKCDNGRDPTDPYKCLPHCEWGRDPNNPQQCLCPSNGNFGGGEYPNCQCKYGGSFPDCWNYCEWGYNSNGTCKPRPTCSYGGTYPNCWGYCAYGWYSDGSCKSPPPPPPPPPPPTCTYGGTYPNCWGYCEWGWNSNGSCKPRPTCEWGGTYPNCNPRPTCEWGGTYPNCNPRPSCPSGYTGTYPNCTPPRCTYGGTYPNCWPYCQHGWNSNGTCKSAPRPICGPTVPPPCQSPY